LILINLILNLLVLNACETVFALNFSIDAADITDEEYYFADLSRWVIALLIFIGIAVSVHISMLGKYRRKNYKV